MNELTFLQVSVVLIRLTCWMSRGPFFNPVWQSSLSLSDSSPGKLIVPTRLLKGELLAFSSLREALKRVCCLYRHICCELNSVSLK